MRVAMSSSSDRSPVSSSNIEDDGACELRKGPWTPQEDALLTSYISSHGEGRWNLLAKCSGLRRNGKSCRLRWLNYLKPDVKRGNLTLQEQFLILELHSKFGNRWSKIAQHLPGRTDNEIKNYWRTRVQKQARHMNIDSGSAAFQNVIRRYWMPRLLQKIEGASANISQNTSVGAQPLITHGSQHPSPSPQVFQQGPVPTSGYRNGFVPENCSSPSFCASESITAPQVPPANSFQALASTSSYNTDPRSNHSEENSRYDMAEPFGLASMSALGGDFESPLGNCQMVESAWMEYDLADCLWKIDESMIIR